MTSRACLFPVVVVACQCRARVCVCVADDLVIAAFSSDTSSLNGDAVGATRCVPPCDTTNF